MIQKVESKGKVQKPWGREQVFSDGNRTSKRPTFDILAEAQRFFLGAPTCGQCKAPVDLRGRKKHVATFERAMCCDEAVGRSS